MRAGIPLLAMCAALLSCLSQSGCTQSKAPDASGRPAAADASGEAIVEAKVRKAAVAGAFYPRSSSKLTATVEQYVDGAGPQELPGKLVGLISPHAGYEYSGPVAGYAYAAIEGAEYETVVVVGPSHRARVVGAALTDSDYWETPLGRAPIDRALGAKLVALYARFVETDLPQRQEHSIEVQVPFLQHVLGEFKLLPIQVGEPTRGNCAAIAKALVTVLKGRNALLIASTDMSHYPAYDEACRTDQKTLGLMEDWRIADLAIWEQEAVKSGVRELHCTLCGLGPVMIVMEVSRQLGANTVKVLNYANSGDVPAGDRKRCVGYGAVALCHVEGTPEPTAEGLGEPEQAKAGKAAMETSEGELNEQQQKYLLELARRQINDWVTKRERVKPTQRDGVLGEQRAVFVTIEEFGDLRGCIGSLEPREALVDAIVSRARAAATEDHRFRPVEPKELPHLKLHLSVLSPKKRIDDVSEIVVGEHGVIIRRGLAAGVFLPEVAPQQGWDRQALLTNLCTKARLAPDAWRKGASLWVFTTQSFGDPAPDGSSERGQ